jgi:signal transduction histidine kinase
MKRKEIFENGQQQGFLSGGGEMGELIRSYNWESTSLGVIGTWPQSLKTAINIVLQSPVPMVMLWGVDGIMIYNDAYSFFAGRRHPFLLGSKVVEGWPEVADFNRNVMDKGLRGETLSYKDQNLVLYRNNISEEVWMDLNYSPIMDESGEPAGVLAIVVETSQRVLAEQKQKRAEEDLKVQKQRLYEVFMQAPTPVNLYKGPNHIIELTNQHALKIYGRTHEEVINKPLLEAVPELQGTGIKELLDEVYSTGKTYYGNEYKVQLYGKDNTLEDIYFNFVYEPLRDSDGKVEGIMVFAFIVTDQVLARKKVEESESKYRSLFERMDQGFAITEVIFDSDNQPIDYLFLETNPMFALQSGLKDAEGKTAKELAPDLEKHWFDIYGKIALTGESSRFVQGSDALGKWFDVYAFRLGGPESHKVAILFTDITQRKKDEEKLRLKNEELIKINNDLDNFIYTASHDLKAPVSNLEGLFMTLLSEIDLKDDLLPIKTMIDTSFQRFKNTIKDLTEITKVQKGELEKSENVQVAEIVNEVKSSIYEQIDRYRAEIQTEFNVEEIRFSKKNLRSIIYNLISNAIKYSSPERKPLIKVTTNREEAYVVITVIDNGLGIPAENRHRMFQMFKRMHDHVEGTGIGLYIVKRIIDNAGGKIEVESEVGKGTTFRVYLLQN